MSYLSVVYNVVNNVTFVGATSGLVRAYFCHELNSIPFRIEIVRTVFPWNSKKVEIDFSTEIFFPDEK